MTSSAADSTATATPRPTTPATADARAAAPSAASARADHDAAMRAYLAEGERRAFTLGNRGPIRFTADGKVHPDILDAYWRCGFYVFEGVLKPDELADIEADIRNILERLPSERGSPVDAKGRPALGVDCTAPTLFWARPLGDPVGGTKANKEVVGRDLDFLAVNLRAVVADNVVAERSRLHQFSGGTHRVEHREKILPEQGGKVAPAETDALTVVN
ncbi:MAG TPA: hypothetical protein PK072_12435, partial [Quisquiliibacterium sp.]|nr:hypothetical protein [Quisquiliibacterium sp.]